MTVRKAGTANEITAIRMRGRRSQQRDASTHATKATTAKREDFGVTAAQQEDSSGPEAIMPCIRWKAGVELGSGPNDVAPTTFLYRPFKEGVMHQFNTHVQAMAQDL